MREKGEILLLVVLVAGLASINLLRRPAPAASTAAARAARLSVTRHAASPAIPDALLAVAAAPAGGNVRAAALRRNIFEYAALPPAAAPSSIAPPAAAEPPRPPAPVRFYGFVESGGTGSRQAFLTDGEEIYVAAEGEIILRRYRLVRLQKESLELEDLVGKNRWVVPLEQP